MPFSLPAANSGQLTDQTKKCFALIIALGLHSLFNGLLLFIVAAARIQPFPRLAEAHSTDFQTAAEAQAATSVVNMLWEMVLFMFVCKMI